MVRARASARYGTAQGRTVPDGEIGGGGPIGPAVCDGVSPRGPAAEDAEFGALVSTGVGSELGGGASSVHTTSSTTTAALHSARIATGRAS
jgi:hypothetical protein